MKFSGTVGNGRNQKSLNFENDTKKSCILDQFEIFVNIVVNGAKNVVSQYLS